MLVALKNIRQILFAISRIGVWASGFMLLAAALFIVTEVVLRKLFSYSIGGADELSSYALAIGSVWALSFALLERAHIRIDALYMLIPDAGKLVLDGAAIVSFFAAAFFLWWFCGKVFLTSLKIEATANTPLGTPLWIPQGLWVLGFSLFALTSSVMLLEFAWTIVFGSKSALHALVGIVTPEEELQHEIEQVADVRRPEELN